MPSNARMVTTAIYNYDDLDRLFSVYDGEMRITANYHDNFGNVFRTMRGTDENNEVVDYEYDAAGNVIKSTQGDHITTYEYDLAGRLVKTTDPMEFSETYTYDTAGNTLMTL